MIGYIKGTIKYLELNSMVVENGIGYRINTLTEGYSVGSEVELFIETIVRENEISLWGFKSNRDLEIFKLLILVSGVGPRIAQALIFNKGVDAIVNAIRIGDDKSLKVTGVGNKIAQKIILELKDKVGSYTFNDLESIGHKENDSNLITDAVDALLNLGYREMDINAVLSKLKNDITGFESSQEIIKYVLKNI
jgi:Holliday junction DNA helicase RuvA